MLKPLISMIVPVYNAEKLINKCLYSIINQTYSNLEIIVVNDGSFDNTVSIINNIKDSRIKLINKENGGVSSARNTGITNATGDFLMFVDADDYLSKDAVEVFVDNIQNDCDYYVCSNIDSNTNSFIKIDNINNKKEYVYNILYWKKDYKIDNISCVFNKLYKTSLVKNKINFNNNLTMGEDMLFNIYYLFLCNRIKIINKELYFKNVDDNSITNKKNKKIVEKDLLFQNELFTIIKDKFDDSTYEIAKYRAPLGGILTCCNSYYFKGDIKDFKNSKQELIELINTNNEYKESLNHIDEVKEYFGKKQVLLLKLIKNNMYYLAYLLKKIS